MVLRADASVPMRRRSSRAPRVTGSAVTATGEAPHSVAAAAELQQVAASTMAVMTTTPSISPVPAPVGGSQAVVVEVPDDDTPPPGWD
jgi:LDH2 family malate/lactate/ureidoglycolate dehydrogenase